MYFIKEIRVVFFTSILSCLTISNSWSKQTDINGQMYQALFESIESEKDPKIISWPSGETFEFLRTGETTCGHYLLAKAIIPPGAGPLPHVHHWTNEWFFTPKKGIYMYMGSKIFDNVNLPPDKLGGDSLNLSDIGDNGLMFGPKNIIHGLFNATNHDLILYFLWTPDKGEHSILNYFETVGVRANSIKDKPYISELEKIKFVSEAPRFGINQSHDLWQYANKITFNPIEKNNTKFTELQSIINTGNCLHNRKTQH